MALVFDPGEATMKEFCVIRIPCSTLSTVGQYLRTSSGDRSNEIKIPIGHVPEWVNFFSVTRAYELTEWFFAYPTSPQKSPSFSPRSAGKAHDRRLCLQRSPVRHFRT
jgi:hypothetical protein